jgi:ribosome-associated protein
MRNLAGRLDGEGKLHVIASEERSQAQNRELAVGRLTSIIADALRPPPAARRPTKPSKGAQERRLASKKARGQLKRLRSTASED